MDRETIIGVLTSAGDVALVGLIIILTAAAVMISSIMTLRRRRRASQQKSRKVWRDERRAQARAREESNVRSGGEL